MTEVTNAPRIIEVCINGTAVVLEVELVGQNITSHGCRILAREKNHNLASALSIGPVDMDILWERYRTQPLQFEQAVVRVRRVHTSHLKSVELIGKNDPFVVMTFGDVWSGQTSTIEEGGADAEWEVLPEEQESMQFQVTREELTKHKMNVCVSDENKFRSHVVIGEADVSLSALLEAGAYEHEHEFSACLRTKKGKESGSVVFSVDLIRCDVECGDVESITQSTRGTFASLQEAWDDINIHDDFVRFIAKHYIDLFLSRSSSVMILRLKPLS